MALDSRRSQVSLQDLRLNMRQAQVVFKQLERRLEAAQRTPTPQSSARSQQAIPSCSVKQITLKFLYLYWLLLSAVMQPYIAVEYERKFTGFFCSYRLEESVMRQQVPALHSMCQVAVFSLLATLGYVQGGCLFGKAQRLMHCWICKVIQPTQIGFLRKYQWLCFVPWILRFIVAWLPNAIAGLVFLLRMRSLAEPFMMAFIGVQALLASEVLCLALHGCCDMLSVDYARLAWEQWKSQVLPALNLRRVDVPELDLQVSERE